jgi:DNA-binding IscR family transcriptional regulator
MTNKPLSNLEKQILNTLPYGRRNAITLVNIAILLNINKKRVSMVISDLRKSGYVIGSTRKTHGGMYLIENSDEFWETVNTLQNSINSQQEVISALLKHEGRFEK